MNIDEAAYGRALRSYESGNYEDCLGVFLSLSDQGHAKSSFYAGSIYLRGHGDIGCDEVRARELYALTLEQEFMPGAALSIALMEYEGIGGKKDYKSSMRHYLMVNGNPFAKIMIGVMLQYGKGCERDETVALRWLDGAWSLGHPLGLKQASLIRLRSGQLLKGLFDYLRSTFMMIWFYGIRKIPKLRSPDEVLGLGWRSKRIR